MEYTTKSIELAMEAMKNLRKPSPSVILMMRREYEALKFVQQPSSDRPPFDPIGSMAFDPIGSMRIEVFDSLSELYYRGMELVHQKVECIVIKPSAGRQPNTRTG